MEKKITKTDPPSKKLIKLTQPNINTNHTQSGLGLTKIKPQGPPGIPVKKQQKKFSNGLPLGWMELTTLCFICTMDAEQKAYLKTIYYDPSHPASYSGLDRLYREVKREGRYNIKRKDLKNWLTSQETYGLHRQDR